MFLTHPGNQKQERVQLRVRLAEVRPQPAPEGERPLRGDLWETRGWLVAAAAETVSEMRELRGVPRHPEGGCDVCRVPAWWSTFPPLAQVSGLSRGLSPSGEAHSSPVRPSRKLWISHTPLQCHSGLHGPSKTQGSGFPTPGADRTRGQDQGPSSAGHTATGGPRPPAWGPGATARLLLLPGQHWARGRGRGTRGPGFPVCVAGPSSQRGLMFPSGGKLTVASSHCLS